MNYFIYDTETTGLGAKDEVIQFSGFLLNEEWKLKSVVNFYSYTQVAITEGAARVNQMNHGKLWELSDGKTFEEQIFDHSWLFEEEDVVFIGYNVAFDNRLVNQTLKRNGFPEIDFGKSTCSLKVNRGRYHFDLMQAMASIFNQGKRMKLTKAVELLTRAQQQRMDQIYDNVFKTYGKSEKLTGEILSKFHNSLYDSFVCWFLISSFHSRLLATFSV